MNPHDRRPHARLVYGLLLFGVIARLAPHPWNATPIMAIGLLAGTYVSKRWAVLLPLGIAMVSDAVLGWHATMPFTWGAFALTGMLAWWIRQRPTAARIVTSALAGSSLFFIISNLGVWIAGSLYPRTAVGLAECFLAAIPFFRTELIGNLLYTTALFAAYHLAAHSPLTHQAAKS